MRKLDLCDWLEVKQGVERYQSGRRYTSMCACKLHRGDQDKHNLTFDRRNNEEEEMRKIKIRCWRNPRTEQINESSLQRVPHTPWVTHLAQWHAIPIAGPPLNILNQISLSHQHGTFPVACLFFTGVLPPSLYTCMFSAYCSVSAHPSLPLGCSSILSTYCFRSKYWLNEWKFQGIT